MPGRHKSVLLQVLGPAPELCPVLAQSASPEFPGGKGGASPAQLAEGGIRPLVAASYIYPFVQAVSIVGIQVELFNLAWRGLVTLQLVYVCS